jgi:hypothetical protein
MGAFSSARSARAPARLAVLVVVLVTAGCPSTQTSSPSAGKEKPNRKNTTANASKRDKPATKSPRRSNPRPQSDPPLNIERRPAGSLADLIKEGEEDRQKAPGAVDEAALAAAGIRKIEGKHLTLYTDLPSSPPIDELPQVFDRAVPQWCEYLGIDAKKIESWKIRGSLMKDKKAFARVGLWSESLPPFLHGYARAGELWLYDQPSQYYRRHLLLHEGTHAIMLAHLGGAGPPWYMEGVAELLATHRWGGDNLTGGKLTLNYFPKSREEVPELGRIKIVRDAFAGGAGKSLNEIINYDGTAHLQNEPYGWCWAAAAFLDGHPRYRERFRALVKQMQLTDAAFNNHLREVFQKDLPAIAEEWQVFVAGMEYGYDIHREAIDFAPGQAIGEDAMTLNVSVDRGWQSSGIKVEAGKTYRLTAQGRFQIVKEPKIWWCEPGGVTIRYHRGRPLGMLIAAVRADDFKVGDASGLLQPESVGLGVDFTPKQSGTLMLRINDSPAELADNEGMVAVEIKRL